MVGEVFMAAYGRIRSEKRMVLGWSLEDARRLRSERFEYCFIRQKLNMFKWLQ